MNNDKTLNEVADDFGISESGPLNAVAMSQAVYPLQAVDGGRLRLSDQGKHH